MSYTAPASISNIIILDTHPVLRLGLTVLLKKKFKNTVVLHASGLEDFRQANPQCIPSIFIVVVNSDFEDNGPGPIAQIRLDHSDAAVILYGEEVRPELVISYLRSGVNGYLSKHEGLNELIICIKAVALGKRHLSSGHMEYLFNYLLDHHKPATLYHLLTPRQSEIARYLVEGLSTSLIAEKTGLHISTISTFKTAIFSKLAVSNVLDLQRILDNDKSASQSQ
jgi:DNA-binding NarL/FixJ family response regulator